MPTKRKKSSSSTKPSKYQRSALAANSNSQAGLKLFDLPLEILEIIVSHIIVLPFHPANATFPRAAIKNLFPDVVLQVNRRLRHHALDFISKQCLWIDVQCLTRCAHQSLCQLIGRLPIIRPIFRKLLRADFSGIFVELGDPKLPSRTLRSFNPDEARFAFPFNYHSWMDFYYACLLEWADICHITISERHMPGDLRKIFEEQMLPVFPLAKFQLPVKVVAMNGQVTCHEHQETIDMQSTMDRIDQLMQQVNDLDSQGHPLEATLLCMYQGYQASVLAGYASEHGLSRPHAWTGSNGTLRSANWRSNETNLQRMKAVRTLHHIEYRACIGYVSGGKNLNFRFALAHFIPLTSITNYTIGTQRWLREPGCMYFGLPDHELAQLHHARAELLQCQAYWLDIVPNTKLVDANTSPDMSDPSRMRREATWYAYGAWSYDMKNKNYAAWLQFALTQDPGGLQDLRDRLPRMLESFKDDDVDGGKSSYHGHADFFGRWSAYWPYFKRAQEVAKMANVAYDSRRGEQYTQGLNDDEFKDQVTKLLHLGTARQPEAKVQCPDWSALGYAAAPDDSNDVMINMHTDIAPWSDWTCSGLRYPPPCCIWTVTPTHGR